METGSAKISHLLVLLFRKRGVWLLADSAVTENKSNEAVKEKVNVFLF